MQDLKPQRAVESDRSWHFVGAQCDRADSLDHGRNSPVSFPRASNSQPASRVQILSGHYNTAVRVPLPLQLRESEMFDLGSVPYKDSDELCIACVLSAHTLSVQKGSLLYPAPYKRGLHERINLPAPIFHRPTR